jgi:exonuclease III
MRIVTWNSNRAFGKKASALLELDPDVAIIQECERDFVTPAGYKYLWIGALPHMGLGVLTRDQEARIDPGPKEEWTFFMPVTLPVLNLRLLATWAFQRRASSAKAPNRVGTIPSVLAPLESWLSVGRSVMAGDFNHNLKWDTPRGTNNFRPVVHQLHRAGLRSAYHEATLEGFGQEKQPTHLFRRNAKAEYHIDYCFVHQSLGVASAEVLRSEHWGKLSDHFPLVVNTNDA